MNSKPKTTWIVTTVIALFAIVAGTYYSIRPKQQAENSNAAADVSLTFNTPTINSNINTTLTPKIMINPTTNQVTAVEVNLTFDPSKININGIINSGVFSKTLREPLINNINGTASFIYGIDVASNNMPVTVTTVSDVATISLTTKNIVGDAIINVLNTSIVTAKDIDTSVLGTYGQMIIHISNAAATPATYLNWDVNMDSKINIVDIGLVVDNYGSDTPTTSRADINNDGTINVVDIGIVIDNYQW